MNRWFSKFAQAACREAGKSYTFVAATLSILIWLGFGPYYHWSDTYQLVANSATTVITFLMVFLLQNSQNRDTVAVHVKLDELIKATKDARNQLAGVETLSDLEIEAIKTRLLREVGR